MKRMRYLMRVIRRCQLKQFRQAVRLVHRRTGRSRLGVTLDMLFCALRYGAGYNDYVMFGFDQKEHKICKTYLTRFQNRKLINLVNDPEHTGVFENRVKFYMQFSALLGRDFLLVEEASEEELAAFLEKHPVVFAKSKEDGRCLERLVVAEFASVHQLVHYVMNPVKRFTVLEEEVVQHPAVRALHPCSVNCLRVVTLLADDGTCHTLYAVLKMGNEGRCTDGRQGNGLVCPVDLSTGRMAKTAYMPGMKGCTEHPYTGVRFEGYVLPFVREAAELAKKAALMVPRVRYVGWNIALSEEGPVLMEGVSYPEYRYGQLPEEPTGNLPLIQKYVKGM